MRTHSTERTYGSIVYTFKDQGQLVWIGQADRRRLISVLKGTRHQLWIGGRQLANIVFADIRCGTILHTMRSRNKRQPASQLLLSGTTIGEKNNFVWEEPSVDLPQQFTGVVRRWITGDEYLFRLCESKIESGSKGRYCLGVREKTSGECGKRFIGFVAPLSAVRELCEPKKIHGGSRIG